MPPKRTRLSASLELENEDLSTAIAAAKEKVADAVDSLQSLLVDLEARKAALDEEKREQQIVEEKMAMNRERAASIVKLNLRGKVFMTYKETLLKVKDTYFFRMLSSGQWQPEEGGDYFIDACYEGFERVLAYLSSGALSVKGLNEYEKECVYDNLDYFQIPYTNRERSYRTYETIEEMEFSRVIELSDGRLCGAIEKNLVVWNTSSKSVELTLTSESAVSGLIQVLDRRICSAMEDWTIRVWNLQTETSELTLVGHSNYVNCIAQLFDGRLCSGSDDYSIRIWNLDSGLCEQTIDTGLDVYCFAQLSDGNLCCGSPGPIQVWNIESGDVQFTLENSEAVNSIAIIGEARIVVCSYVSSVKLWNLFSHLCERTLVGHTSGVNSVVRLYDGRLCTASEDFTIRIWNDVTGDCEMVLKADDDRGVHGVLQLQDGRLVESTIEGGGIRMWS